MRALAAVAALAALVAAGAPLSAHAGRGGGSRGGGGSYRAPSYRAPVYRSSYRAPSHRAPTYHAPKASRAQAPSVWRQPPAKPNDAAFRAQREAKQAAAAAKKQAHVEAQRRALAADFMRKDGKSEAAIERELRGMQAGKPVRITTLKRGTELQQAQVPDGRRGSYYSKPGVAPDQVGIHTHGAVYNENGEAIDVQPRVPQRYTVNKETRVLRSTAAPIVDDWSVPGEKHPTQGGETQYYTRDRTRIVPTAPNAK